MRWPDFTVPGMPKCGTSSLTRYLREHPDVAMSEPKMSRLHMHDDTSEAEIEKAFRHADTASLRGDATVIYLADAAVPARIMARAPGTKHLVCVRDPVERTISHYWFRVQYGKEVRPLAEVVQLGERADIIRHGMIGTNLRRWMEFFPRDSFHFIHAHELRAQPDSVLTGIHLFLGVRPHSSSVTFESNATAYRRSEAVVRLTTALQKRGITSRIPVGLKDRLRPLSIRMHRRGASGTPRATGAERRALAELFAPEVDLFTSLTGLEVVIGMNDADADGLS